MRINALIFSVLLCFFSSSVQAFSAGEFSADVVTTSREGSVAMKMYSSADGKKSRMETPQGTMIVRQDLKVMWMLMPSEGMYLEQPLDLQMVMQISREMPGEIERVPMGSEVVNAIKADKFKITFESSGQRDSVYQWVSADQLPVRTQAVNGSWTVDFKNVSSKPQSPSLFEVPPGFQKLAMPSMDTLMANFPQQ